MFSYLYLSIYHLFHIINSLKISERELGRIAGDQQSNVMTLVDLVKENEKILDAMKVSGNMNSFILYYFG